MAKWIGWGMPLRTVRFDQIAWVELRQEDGTLHLIGGAAVEIDNESLLEVAEQLRKAGISDLSAMKRWRPIDPESPPSGSPPSGPRDFDR